MSLEAPEFLARNQRTPVGEVDGWCDGIGTVFLLAQSEASVFSVGPTRIFAGSSMWYTVVQAHFAQGCDVENRLARW